jgi:hypothetical protein
MKIQTATLAASMRTGFSFEYGDGDGLRRFEDKMSKSASYRTSADDGYVQGHLGFWVADREAQKRMMQSSECFEVPG